MPPLAKFAAAFLTLAVLPASAQSGPPATPSNSPKPSPPITALFNRNVIYIDPAHGGSDSGAHLTSQLVEKDVTLALGLKLRDALTARGFTVVLARQTDDPNSPALDDRAGVANHVRPVACILIHATAASRGVHLYASSLTPPGNELHALPWDSAQASWVPQSLRLANELGTSLARAHTSVLIHRADPKPLSSLTCPAIALEIAPLSIEGANPTPVNDTGYQQRIADSVANALVFWKNHADPQPISTPSPASDSPTTKPEKTPSSVPAPAAPKPAPKPRPVPAKPINSAPEPVQFAPRRGTSPALPQAAALEPIR